jgi:hypothetical protein
MALFMVLVYLVSAVGIACIALGVLGWCILIVEWIQDEIEKRRKR